MMFVRWDGATEESIDLLAQSLMDGAATKIAVTQVIYRALAACWLSSAFVDRLVSVHWKRLFLSQHCVCASRVNYRGQY